MAIRGLGAISGHWSFESPDLFLSAKIGDPMLELDSETGWNTEFGTTGVGAFADVPGIEGQPVAVMKFPKTTRTGGYYDSSGGAPDKILPCRHSGAAADKNVRAPAIETCHGLG